MSSYKVVDGLAVFELKLRGYPGSLRFEDGRPMCQRVEDRVTCDECRYPYSESMCDDYSIPHGLVHYEEYKKNERTESPGSGAAKP